MSNKQQTSTKLDMVKEKMRVIEVKYQLSGRQSQSPPIQCNLVSFDSSLYAADDISYFINRGHSHPLTPTHTSMLA